MTTRRGPYAKSAERRRVIVDAAFEVFAQHGYRGGSLQQVADSVGISQTSLLYHFPTKGELLAAVLARRDAVSADRAAEVADADDLVARVVTQATANEGVPGLVALYAVTAGEAVTEGHPGRAHVADRFARLRHEFAEDFARLAAAGRLRPGVDPATAAAGLVALWDGLQLQWLLDPAVDVAGGLRAHLEVFVAPTGGQSPDAAAAPDPLDLPDPLDAPSASAAGTSSPDGTNR